MANLSKCYKILNQQRNSYTLVSFTFMVNCYMRARFHTAPRWFIGDFKWLLTDSSRTENMPDREKLTKGVLYTMLVNGIHVRHKSTQHSTFVSIQNGIDAQHSYTHTPAQTCMNTQASIDICSYHSCAYMRRMAKQNRQTNALIPMPGRFMHEHIHIHLSLSNRRFGL